VLGSPRQERYDRMTRLACNMFDVAFATIAIADGDSFWAKSTFADWGREFALPPELFRAAMQADSTLVIPDLNADETAGSLRAAVDGTIRFFAGAPLRNSQGIEIGAFCIGDRRARTLDDGLLAVFADLTEWVRREMITSSDASRARALQQRLLPSGFPRIPGYQMQAMCTRAGSVGGDFYDWQPLGGDRVVFTVADVVGKGTAAAIMSATLRGALRSAIADAAAATCEDAPGLARAVTRAADVLRPDLQATGKFATAFVAMLSPAEHRLSWVDAGHGLAVLNSAGGAATWLGRGDPALGIRGSATWTEHSTVFRPGDTLLVFSDGLFELGDTTVQSLGDVQGLVSREGTADRVIATLGELAADGVPTDDITAVAIHRLPFSA
jgi:serine phosphatase RsbU (regulator of sigma subunit)